MSSERVNLYTPAGPYKVSTTIGNECAEGMFLRELTVWLRHLVFTLKVILSCYCLQPSKSQGKSFKAFISSSSGTTNERKTSASSCAYKIIQFLAIIATNIANIIAVRQVYWS